MNNYCDNNRNVNMYAFLLHRNLRSTASYYPLAILDLRLSITPWQSQIYGFLLDIFNNYLRLPSTTTPRDKLHGAISKCIYNIIFKSPFNYPISPFNLSVSICLYLFYFYYSKTNISNSFSFYFFFEIYEKAISLFIF